MNTLYENTLGPILVRFPWLCFLVLLWLPGWNWMNFFCNYPAFVNRRPRL